MLIIMNLAISTNLQFYLHKHFYSFKFKLFKENNLLILHVGILDT